MKIALPDECEDDRIRVDGADATVGRERQGEIQRREDEIEGNKQPHKHPDETPADRRDGEVTHDPVIVREGLYLHGASSYVGL